MLELGLLALRAEVDLPVAADGEPEGEDHEAGGGQHEGPAAVVDQPVEHPAWRRPPASPSRRAPQTTKARVSTAVTPNTTRSVCGGRRRETPAEPSPATALLRSCVTCGTFPGAVIRRIYVLRYAPTTGDAQSHRFNRRCRARPSSSRWYGARSSSSSGTRARRGWRSGTYAPSPSFARSLRAGRVRPSPRAYWAAVEPVAAGRVLDDLGRFGRVVVGAADVDGAAVRVARERAAAVAASICAAPLVGVGEQAAQRGELGARRGAGC